MHIWHTVVQYVSVPKPKACRGSEDLLAILSSFLPLLTCRPECQESRLQWQSETGQHFESRLWLHSSNEIQGETHDLGLRSHLRQWILYRHSWTTVSPRLSLEGRLQVSVQPIKSLVLLWMSATEPLARQMLWWQSERWPQMALNSEF